MQCVEYLDFEIKAPYHAFRLLTVWSLMMRLLQFTSSAVEPGCWLAEAVVGFSAGDSGKESSCQRRRRERLGFASWIRGGGHGSPLQGSSWDNLMASRAWWDTAHGVEKSGMTRGLSMQMQKGWYVRVFLYFLFLSPLRP